MKIIVLKSSKKDFNKNTKNYKGANPKNKINHLQIPLKDTIQQPSDHNNIENRLIEAFHCSFLA